MPLHYSLPLFRPPAEGESLIIQLTEGCSYNSCTFCGMYKDKQFNVRPLSTLFKELEHARSHFEQRGQTIRKIFIADGDALAAPYNSLLAFCEKANALFPKLKRISIYASARNIKRLNDNQLKELRQFKLSLAYIGLESGANEVLSLLNKGSTAEESESACLKLSRNGWDISAIILIGAGGRDLSELHQQKSANILSTIAPKFLSFLSIVPVPQTPYYNDIGEGKIAPLTVKETLVEMASMLKAIKPAVGKRTIFRSNHVSNYFPLEGILPRDTMTLVEGLNVLIKECPEGVYSQTNYHYL